jgi:hypothetical protein
MSRFGVGITQILPPSAREYPGLLAILTSSIGLRWPSASARSRPSGLRLLGRVPGPA